MKAIHSMMAVAAIALGMSVPASAATTDPEVIIYRFPGVLDNGGGPNMGVATSFHCTNFSGTTENIRLVTRGFNGILVANFVTAINHLDTHTLVTHATAAYNNDFLLNTGVVSQGTTAIAATSINIVCTAETIDASTAVPIGVARRGIRFSPVPGSQE